MTENRGLFESFGGLPSCSIVSDSPICLPITLVARRTVLNAKRNSNDGSRRTERKHYSNLNQIQSTRSEEDREQWVPERNAHRQRYTRESDDSRVSGQNKKIKRSSELGRGSRWTDITLDVSRHRTFIFRMQEIRRPAPKVENLIGGRPRPPGFPFRSRTLT